MIPRISEHDTVSKQYLGYIKLLKSKGFKGDLNADYANRIALSTDNSIYQYLPQAVVYPKHIDDLVLIAECANLPEFLDIGLTPRGGGTGTNGQSLTDGIVVDISKHMNQVLEINAEERWVRVQTGVVKDQLNAALKPYGLFFAPELSTSNRATIGGMINTDASGQGSCMYGKTRDHVLSLKSVLLDGSVLDTGAIAESSLEALKTQDTYVGRVHQVVDDVFERRSDDIEKCFPKLNRCLTGYDLAHIREEDGRFNLNSVLCGSEGSLTFIAEAKLNVLAIPKCSALVNIKYDSFESSLRDAKALTAFEPTSVETIDSKVLNLAMNDIVWDTVAHFFPSYEGEPQIQGINLIEYTGDDQAELDKKVAKLTAHLEQVAGKSGQSFGYTVAKGVSEIGKIWGMRKKSVGLLGNASGENRPIPFVEDTAVPPENLADFIMEFRAVLDKRGLAYGMFGHVDAGVLHVRPAIDMKDESQTHLIREITDEVVALTQKYNGLLWGEHGKGVRSEYSPEFFGDLYPELQRIKAAFDPRGQLNRGKIATPLPEDKAEPIQLLKIDEVPTRGDYDREISESNRQYYNAAAYCNGNGACYNYDPNDAMCPSWKGTRKRTHAPKGRSSLIREWLRLMQAQGVDMIAERDRIRQAGALKALPQKIWNSLKKRDGQYDFSHEVHESMMACLACKSCVGQCPIKVNVPEFRARFLEAYYARYLRPAKDYLVASLETIVPTAAKVPSLYNAVMSNSLVKSVLKNQVGMVDSPLLSRHSLLSAMEERGIELATPERLGKLSATQRSKVVVIVQDAFTSYFESSLVVDVMDFLGGLGFYVMVAPFKPNGKPLHVHGFLGAFEDVAVANAQMLHDLAACGVDLVGVDPSMTLTYRQEYVKDGFVAEPPVKLLQEWLATKLDVLEGVAGVLPKGEYYLMAHCTEKTNAAGTIKLWQQVFAALGQTLNIQAVGCCGMSGTYGHETANFETSKEIYNLSWANAVSDERLADKLVATGYSCRSQVKRFDNKEIPHPVQVLLQVLQEVS